MLFLGIWLASLPAFTQLIPNPDPVHTLVYRVNSKCGDTLQVTRHLTSLRLMPTSKTRCPVIMSFGGIFWRRKEYLLILEQDALFLMLDAMHKDRMFGIAPGLQSVASPFGAYKVRVTEEGPLFGKWRTYRAEFKPENNKTVLLLLRFNPQIGIVSLEDMGAKGAKIGFLELFSVDGKPLEQFVRESGIE